MDISVLGKRRREGESGDDAEDILPEGVLRLTADLRQALNRPENSDVTFVCKEGCKVYATRWLLSLKSPYFKGMFENNMLESTLAEIPLTHFASSVLLWVFEYLYTGLVPSFRGLSWKMGFEVIGAADFFLVPASKTAVGNFLRKEATRAQCLSRDDVIGMVSEALQLKQEWEGTDSLLLELTTGLRKTLFDKDDYCDKDFLSWKLPENALEYILSTWKGGEKPGTPSVKEYHIFRLIIQWLLHQGNYASEQVVQTKLLEILPIEKSADMLWSTIAEFRTNVGDCTLGSLSGMESHNPTAVLNSRLGAKIRRDSLERLLKYISWNRIPPTLLLKVICPLQVMAPQAAFDALAFHVLHRSVHCFDAQRWDCFGNFCCDPQGRVSCQSEDGLRSARGWAIARLPIDRLLGTYEWNVEISHNDADLVMIGIVSQRLDHRSEERGSGQPSATYDLIAALTLVLTHRDGHTLVTIGTTISSTKTENKADHTEKFPVEVSKLSPIRFTFDALANTCCASIGSSFTTVWRDLPRLVFYPGIHLTWSRLFTAKIQVQRGFRCC